MTSDLHLCKAKCHELPKGFCIWTKINTEGGESKNRLRSYIINIWNLIYVCLLFIFTVIKDNKAMIPLLPLPHKNEILCCIGWIISLSELSEHFEMSYFPLWIIRTFWNELFPFMTYLQFIQEKAYITFSGLYAFVHYKLSSPPFYWFYWKNSEREITHFKMFW
jgi:hypothetical protein